MDSNILVVPTATLLEDARRLLAAGHTVTIRLRGRSMRPFLEHERDKVLVEPSLAVPRVGDVVLAREARGCYVLHRVVGVGSDLTLRGDGNVHGTEHCRPSDVIGVARGFYRGRRERYTACTSFGWKLYSWWWMHTTWMRRYQLWIYRVLLRLKIIDL